MKNSGDKNTKKTAEIEKLQRRIFELEQTLSSIQAGKVDALIIKDAEGNPSVFTLEGANQPYRMLVESLAESVVSLTFDGIIVHCNQSFSEIMQVPVKDLVKSSFLNYIMPTQIAAFLDFLEMSKVRSCKKEFSLKLADQSIKSVLISFDFVELGHADGVSLIVTDITELKSTRQKVEIANKHYRAIMDNASCGISIHDVNGIILDVNKQSEITLGSSKSDLIGESYEKFVLPAEINYVELLMKKLLIEKKIGPVQVHIKQPNDNVINLEVYAVCFDIGNETLLLCVTNDITQRMQLQKQFMLNDKLATIGTLAAGIIHEINNPLTSVFANLSYFTKKLNALKPADDNQLQLIQNLKEIVDETTSGLGKINDIVKELKSYSRSDDLPLPVFADLHDTLESAIKMAYPQFKNLAVIKRNYSNDIPNILLNHKKLHQVFLNLIINAAQSLSQHQDNVIEITTANENNRVRIDIADTGKGISEEVLTRIFEPFFTTKPIGLGTGLGLSICKDIITNEGGEIKVSSVVGKGTIFSIYLPFKTQDTCSTSPESTSATSKNRLRILVVDDESMMINMLKIYLSGRHEITTALGGIEALRLLQIKPMPFDIIILDLNMPDINGIDLYRYVADTYPGREKSVIFITGAPLSVATNQFLDSIDNICVEKPFTAEQLLGMIDDVRARCE